MAILDAMISNPSDYTKEQLMNSLSDDGKTVLYLVAERKNAGNFQAILSALGDQAFDALSVKFPHQISVIEEGYCAPEALASCSQTMVQDRTPFDLMVRNKMSDAVQSVVEHLGGRVLDLLKFSTMLSDQEKESVQKKVIEAIFFPKLLKGERLSDEQTQLCVKHKEVLKDILLGRSAYSQNIDLLHHAVDRDHPLGQIFHAQRPFLGLSIFERRETDTVRELKDAINRLERASELTSSSL